MVPKVIHGVQDRIIDNKVRSKQYHDDKFRKEAEFQPGEMMFVRLNDRQKNGYLLLWYRGQWQAVSQEFHSHQTSFQSQLVTSNASTLDYTSASISTSAKENQIILNSRHEMSELTNRSSSSKAATTPTRNSSPNFSSWSATVHLMLLFGSTPNSSSMEVFNSTSSDSRSLYLNPSSTITPILGRPKRRIRQPVRICWLCDGWFSQQGGCYITQANHSLLGYDSIISQYIVEH
jgi:hypothetical protein